ncbi:MAG: hypothetical protein HC875_38730 [Anaerolineales bacterium]|nr:hypothetical protein [Anaerolineales bacterium]
MRLYRRMRELLATRPRPEFSEGPRGHNSHDTLVLEGQQALLLAKHRRLNKLRERQALLGIDAPPELLIEIEDLEEEIKNAESRKGSLCKN